MPQKEISSFIKGAGRTISKRSSAGKQFFTTVYIATRTSDDQKGLLFEHQQKLRNGGARKLGSHFFIPEKDLRGFLVVLREVIEQHQDQLARQPTKNLLDLMSLPVETKIHNIAIEIEKLESQLQNLDANQTQRIQHLQGEISKKDEQIVAISRELEKIRQRRQRIRVLEMERQVHLFKHNLAEFKNLAENGKEISDSRGMQQESLYQEFLVKHFWMFGIQYVAASSKPKSATNRIPDLLLQRADGFSDVVELENPTDQVFVNISKRPEQSGALKEALAQTMDYVDDYALRYRDEYYEHGIDTYKPSGIIVIGRRGEQDLERRRRQLNSYLHGIEVWTFDDLISNAEQVIKLLETGSISSME